MLSLSAEVSNQVADQSHDYSVDGGDSHGRTFATIAPRIATSGTAI